jgi:UDP-N-acetylmuramate--alanine ligase
MNDLSQRLTDRSRPLHIHLIGVAGSGMSGLALLLLGMGHRVSGSDRVTTAETERMQDVGLQFSSPHTAEAVRGADLVVYSSAIRPENPAYAAAQSAGTRLLKRAECLAAILHTKKGIIVSGTHGKTTTSSMTAHILREAQLSPSHYVGAEIPILGANAKWSEEGEFMVAEGDESDGTLALYQPEHAIVLNIEAEHLDFYRDLDHIREVFTKMITQTAGKIVYCKEDPVAAELCGPRDNAVSYGWSDADYQACDVRELRGSSAFTVVRRGEILGDVELGIPGRHNVLNALGAIALADGCGADFALIARALATFAGAKRRFETKYLSSRLRIIDDYGHHPSELAATLQTARSLNPGRVVVLFWPMISEKPCKPPIASSSPPSTPPANCRSPASAVRRSSRLLENTATSKSPPCRIFPSPITPLATLSKMAICSSLSARETSMKPAPRSLTTSRRSMKCWPSSRLATSPASSTNRCAATPPCSSAAQRSSG